MISAQIDELRERAKVLRQGRWSDGADDARLMEDAADTIWQLRDDLQRANAENAKLRDGANAMRQLYEDELKHALAENAKLRELVADMWFWHYEGHIDSESQERQMLHIDAVIQRMRELGIEVNDG